MRRLPVLLWVAGLLVGCLAGQHAYLKLSSDYRLPAEYSEAETYAALRDQWLRHSALGLEGGIAAILEDPAVGAALVAYDASRSAGAGRPGKQAAETWDLLYGTGDRIPLRIRWTFNKHFHRQATIEPGNAWRFRLIDDRGLSLEPIEIGHLEQIRDARDWIGEFRIWFPRRTIDGRLLITSHTRSLTLKVDGAAGDASLEWRFLPLLAPGDRPTLE